MRWDRDGAGSRRLTAENLSADVAHDAGAVNTVEPTVGELIVSLDGRAVPTVSGPKLLSTATVVGEGLGRRRQPNQEVRFDRLDIGNQFLHTLISPSIAYLLFVAGLALMVFEFYTCGIGLAGLAGGAALIGALVGFSHLPVAWWAAGLLMLAVFGFAVDVQAGGLGVWTFIGGGALVAGSLTLYGGDARLNPPWWVLAIVIIGTALFMLGAMTAVVRSRFSTPTLGREGMVGEEGRAEVDVAPDGVVVIQGARWRARTNRATPIGAGDAVRVVAVEGLVLEVEPEEGGARGLPRPGAPPCRPAGQVVAERKFCAIRALSGAGDGDTVAPPVRLGRGAGGNPDDRTDVAAARRVPGSRVGAVLPADDARAQGRARRSRSQGEDDLSRVPGPVRVPRLRPQHPGAARHLGRPHRSRTPPSRRRLTGRRRKLRLLRRRSAKPPPPRPDRSPSQAPAPAAPVGKAAAAAA